MHTLRTILGSLLVAGSAFMLTQFSGRQVVAQGQEQGGIEDAFTRVAKAVGPAVVNVSTVLVEKNDPLQRHEFFFDQPDPDGPGQRQVEATGSGVIISDDGYILTNEHVIRKAKEITVTLENKKRYRGKVVGRDARTDIAVIRIETGDTLPFVKMGDSDAVEVGEWVIAIGSPFGLQHTVTQGIVSAVRQSLPIEGRVYRDMIQTDAAINRGNSGGPLCNIRGEVIGINTAIFAPTGVFSGVGFAIPINDARAILDQLIDKGKVVRGWIGVEIIQVDEDIARRFRLPEVRGVLVNRVGRGSPAARAGLRRGDIIMEFNGRQVADAAQFQELVGKTPPKSKVSMRILRGGREITISLVAGEAPPV